MVNYSEVFDVAKGQVAEVIVDDKGNAKTCEVNLDSPEKRLDLCENQKSNKGIDISREETAIENSKSASRAEDFERTR